MDDLEYVRGSRVVMRLEDTRFGKLRPQYLLPITDRQGNHWACLCDCGRLVPVRVKDLRSGNTTSCGCRINRPEVTRDEVSRRQRLLLGMMADRGGSVQQPDIGEMLGVGQGGIFRNVRALVKRGLVVVRAPRGPGAGCGVPNLVALLPAGFAYVRQLRRAASVDARAALVA